MRVGLLAAVVQFYVFGLFIFFPVTGDLGTWYAGAGVTALLVRSKLGRPAIFRQERLGQDGTPFTILKFRTMTDERDQSGAGGALQDEEPGRIPYQVRRGPLALLELNPYSAYYADFASPLMFVISLANLWAWTGDRKQTTLWQIASTGQDAETTHGTQKPVECMKRPIENNSSPGQAVYEPFSGSGTTIIAAEITGRACHAIELMPQYVDVAVERWQAFTGETAKLEADGRPFAEVSAERKPVTQDA